MRAECIDAVEQAIGRSINQTERQGIERRTADHMRREARRDPAAWSQMSRDQRLHAAAANAGQEIIREATKKRVRVALQIAATARVTKALADAKAGGKSQAGALFGSIERFDLDRKGIERQYFGDLVDTMESVHGKLLGLIEDARTAQAIVREIFGESSGSQVAAKAAKAWMDTAEAMRKRFNAAGGDVGKLDYGYIPQPHDMTRVAKAGRDAWVRDMMPLIDRSRYVDVDGRLLNDAEVEKFLGEAWTTIATDGANKITPGKATGSSMLAKRGSEQRQIHFKDADSYLSYMDAYGKSGVLASMQGHVGNMARDIAAVENFGPNPEATFRVARDTIKQQGLTTRVMGGVVPIENAWGTAMGKFNHPGNASIAQVMQGARNLQVASKLGAAVLSSVTDVATIATTSGFHRLPTLKLVANTLKAFGSESADFANRAGLMADSMISDMNRWAEGNIGPGWTSKASSATMRLSLMNAWTDSMRRGFGLTLMGAMGKMSRTSWMSLDDVTRARMARAGIDDATWAIFEQATPENWRGSAMLTKQSIEAIPGLTNAQRNRAVTRLLAFLIDESEYAVVNPDLATRTIQQGGMQKGTVGGELWRSVMLFKSFPVAMLTRHWQRMLTDETMGSGSRMMYASTLLSGLLVMGYVAGVAKDISKGKDPKDVTDPRTWGAAFMQGGGLGILGDFFLQDTTRYGNSMVATLSGPLASTAEDAFKLTIGNVHQAARGDDTKTAAEAIRFLQSNTPMANLWYARAAIDRLLVHNLQEMANPGYLRRMEQRAKKDTGQSFWWQPGQAVPQRAPDISKIVP